MDYENENIHGNRLIFHFRSMCTAHVLRGTELRSMVDGDSVLFIGVRIMGKQENEVIR